MKYLRGRNFYEFFFIVQFQWNSLENMWYKLLLGSKQGELGHEIARMKYIFDLFDLENNLNSNWCYGLVFWFKIFIKRVYVAMNNSQVGWHKFSWKFYYKSFLKMSFKSL